MSIKTFDKKTEVSRQHFFREGERIKIEDKKAIYEIRDPKELAMQVDFGYARYDIILRLIDKYRQYKGMSHLDVGCGLGYLMAKMSQKGFKTSGVDISKSFLDIAEEKLRHWRLSYEELIEADLQQHIDLPNANFDVITATDVLEHIEKPELFLQQIYRLLKEDGIAVISTNNYLSSWGLEKFIRERVFLKRCFHPIDKWSSFYSFRKLVKNCSFKILEMKGVYFLPLNKLRGLFSLTAIYKKRYEINNWLSSSWLRYFGRDIIFVLRK